MANFKTHISVAAAVSGTLAIGCLGGGIASRNEVLLYFTLGTIGGILPDVDADNSIPVRFLFSTLAIIFSFLAMFSKIDAYSLLELALLWMSTVAETEAEAQRIAAASPYSNNPVTGTPDQVAEQLQRFIDLGVTHLIVRVIDFPRLEGIELFAREVIPRLAAH